GVRREAGARVDELLRPALAIPGYGVASAKPDRGPPQCGGPRSRARRQATATFSRSCVSAVTPALRSSAFCTFSLGVLGSASRNRTNRGTANAGTLVLTNS